jgi:cytoskeletal protein RodZ
LPSFGEKLKLEREKRKISLDQISSTTKIGTRMLQALEEEKFSQLPGGIFNKGFVRAYARVVGLDEDQTVADYLQASGEASPARPELVRNAGPRDSSQRDSSPRDTIRIRETVRDKTTRDTAARDKANRDTAAREEEHRISRLEAISDDQSPALPWGVFAVILLIIALLLSLWSHRRREQERQAEHPATPKAAIPSNASPRKTAATIGASTDTPTGTMAGAPASTMTAAPNSESTTPSPPTGARSRPLPAQGGPSNASSSSPSEKAPATPIQTPPRSDPVSPPQTSATHTPAPGEFRVVVHAREESWVSVTVDGKFSGSEVLEPGSERTFLARDHVYIKAGNAGALDFQLDGKTLPVGGSYGEVKAVTIGHAGLIPTVSQSPTNP